MPEIARQVCVGDSIARVLHYAPGEAQAPHSHDRSTISLVLRGELSEVTGWGASEESSSLSVVFKPAGTCHADQVTEHGATLLQIELGLVDEVDDQAERMRASEPGSTQPARRASSAPPRWEWVHATPTAAPFVALARAMAAPSSRTAERLMQGLLPRVLRRLSARTPTATVAPRPWLLETASELTTGPVAIREVATRVGVHPVYLAREFRRCFGESPGAFRRRHRFRRAASLLADTREPLTEVALLAGFADQAHMTRDLARRIGVTPREFRGLSHAF